MAQRAFLGRVTIEAVRRILLWLIIAMALAIAFVLYSTRSGRLNVAPDAERQIEKAKRR
jgi:hypothetical protein